MIVTLLTDIPLETGKTRHHMDVKPINIGQPQTGAREYKNE